MLKKKLIDRALRSEKDIAEGRLFSKEEIIQRMGGEQFDRRLEKYERGEMEFKSWDDAKASIRKQAKGLKASIERGLDESRQGEIRSHDDVMKEIRSRYR